MKYGFKSILRTPVKSILFTFLLTFIIVFLSLGVGMWSVAEGMLDDADEVFLTAGEFTYTGRYDANSYENNETLVTAYNELVNSGILEDDEIIYSEEQKHQKAVVEGYIPSKWSMNNFELMFLTVKVQYYIEDYDGYIVLITATHYSENYQEGTLVFLPQKEVSRILEKSEKLLVLAKAETFKGMAFKGIELLPLDEESGEPLLVNITDDYTEEDFFASSEGMIYQQKIDTIYAENYALDLITTGKAEAVTAFHIGEYTLMEGNFFSEIDYKQGNSCLIPQKMAYAANKGVGDSIHLKIYAPVSGKGLNHCFESSDDIVFEGDFIIKGIYQAEERGTPVYVADNGQSWAGRSDNDNVLGRVILDNRTATAYCEALTEQLPQNVRLTINNEGYDASVQSVYGLLRTARILTITTFFITLLVVGIFRYFFIYSNMDNMKILLQLGTGPKKTLLFFMTGSGCICLLSTILGCFIGYGIADNLINKVFDDIVQNSVYDFRFSINGYGVKSNTFVPTPNINGYIFLLCGLLIAFVLLLWCYWGIRKAVNSFRPGRNKNKTHKKQKRTYKQIPQIKEQKRGERLWYIFEKIPFLSLRYSLRNICRQGIKSFIVPVLLMVLLSFLCFFTSVRNRFEHELTSVYENVPVTLQFTDISGRKIDDLIIYQDTLDDLENLGFIEESWKSTTYYAKFMSLADKSSHSESTNGLRSYNVEPMEIPMNYAWETMQAQWKSTSEPLQIAESLAEAPCFKYKGVPQITWIDGMDENKFISNQPIDNGMEYGCIVPDFYLEKYGLQLGDMIAIAVPYSDDYDISFNVVIIVGVYTTKDSQASVFMTPKAYEASIKDVYYAKWPVNESYIGEKWSSAGAILQNTEQLSSLKDYLDTCFDSVGKAGQYRQWLLIDDRALYDTIDNLTRYIEYMKLLYPIIILLIISLAFFVSNLLLKNRLYEMAMLRSMGCSKYRIFLSIYVEYIILSCIGACIGVGISEWLIEGTNGNITLNTFALLSCFYVGAFVAIIFSFKKSLIYSLKQKEE